MRRSLALAAVAFVSACGGGDDEPEIRPGPVTIGVVRAAGDREQMRLRGVQVAAGEVNGFGGIGGAAPIELVVGSVERLLARGVRLLVLPCEQQAAAAAARIVEASRGVAVAPCDDGGIETSERVVVTGLSPEAQAEALVEAADGPLSLAPTRTERGRAVERALTGAQGGEAKPTIGADAPETVLPQPDAVDGVLYVTYGFPEPGSELDEFYERYRALFGRRPRSVVSALGGDALRVLAAAIEEAGSANPTVVARQLHQEEFEVAGSLGTIELRGDGRSPEVEWVALRATGDRFEVVARP